jgi:iron complex transport system substrate-binding protein
MRIVSLEPYATETVKALGLESALVGITHRCTQTATPCPVVTSEDAPNPVHHSPTGITLGECLGHWRVSLETLRSLKPSHLFTMLPFQRVTPALETALSKALSEACGETVEVVSLPLLTFTQVIEGYERIAEALNLREQGVEIGQRVKAQAMNWADNFYDRMKNKRVSFISNITPLSIRGGWISDLIKLCSAVPQSQSIEYIDQEITWPEVLAFKPDVLIICPRGKTIEEAMATFKQLEKRPEWESLPAVKRGEVIFTEGIDHFAHPGPNIMGSFAIMVSAIAGFESGYITAKDSYFRLRWLEMQRHRY